MDGDTALGRRRGPAEAAAAAPLPSAFWLVWLGGGYTAKAAAAASAGPRRRPRAVYPSMGPPLAPRAGLARVQGRGPGACGGRVACVSRE